MARLSPQTIDKIYQAADIVEVISDYLTVKKRGANYWALSPFANEKTPSFSISPVKGIFKDFSSGKGGNVVTFLMEVEGLTYVEALRRLAQKYNIEIEEDASDNEAYKQATDHRQSLFLVNEFAAKYFHDQLLNAPEGREIGLSYFKERGVLQVSIDEFRLGYAPDQWEAFSGEAQRQQYNPDYLLELGLSSRSEKTGNLTDRFRGRVMFPILNEMGKVLGFGGRILGSKKEVAKYINSPESPIYHKGQVLYGLFQAKKFIREADQCILTEGYLDTVLLHQNGIRNVVASSGTALTPEQCRLIRRFSTNVLMIYDGDAAGVKAALRGLDILLKEGLSAKVAVLPDNHDPDSYVRAVGPAAFQDYLQKSAKDGIEFKIDTEKAALPPGPQSEAKLIHSVAETLVNLNDMVERETYIRFAAGKLGVNEQLVAHAVGEAFKGRAKNEDRESRRQTPGVSPENEGIIELKGFEKLEFAQQEKELLRVLVNHYDKEFALVNGPIEDEAGKAIEYPRALLADFYYEKLSIAPFENQVYEEIKSLIFTEWKATQNPRLHHQLLTHEDPAVSSLVSQLLTIPYELSPGWKKHDAFVVGYDHHFLKTVEGPVNHYYQKRLRKLLHESREGIRKAEQEGDVEQVDYYLKLYSHIKGQLAEYEKKIGIEGAFGPTGEVQPMPPLL